MTPKEALSKDSHQNALNEVSSQSSGNIKEQHFDSWDAFKSTFCEHLFPNEPFRRGKYLFRGHSDPQWKLQTTFDRMFANQPKQTRLQIAEELLEVFKRGLEGQDIPSEVRADESLFHSLGQHYGLPTRLLDWTESPLFQVDSILKCASSITDYADARKNLRNLWMPLLQNHFAVPVAVTGDAGDEGFRERSCISVAAGD